jgi:hypothetical protein
LRAALFLLTLLAPCLLLANSEAGPSGAEESGNVKETGDKLLPGEEVVTPTGKKMRLWDTTGPVPVASVPPEPFGQRHRIRPEDLNVIVAPRPRGSR